MCARPVFSSTLLFLLRRSAGRIGEQPPQSFAVPRALLSFRSKHTLGAAVSSSFEDDPIASSRLIARELSPAHRAILLSALGKEGNAAQHVVHDDAYLSELFKAVDTQAPKGVLTRSEFQQALAAHTSLSNVVSTREVSRGALALIFLASAIPFVAFGFLDNGIMILAGEEIDKMFGAKLGLSTLASAGLGNLVADVVGVGAANFIEAGVKKLPFIRIPQLSSSQISMRNVRVAKFSGALVGVAVGCLLGLTPLFAMGTFFVKPPSV